MSTFSKHARETEAVQLPLWYMRDIYTLDNKASVGCNSYLPIRQGVGVVIPSRTEASTVLIRIA